MTTELAGTRAYRDLTGESFGSLTVVARAGATPHGSVLWLCRCACGGRSSVVSSRLRTGHTKSCGCAAVFALQTYWRDYRTARAADPCIGLGRRVGRHPKPDLTHAVVGQLTVLRPCARVGGRAAWWCRCACGVEKAVQQQSLRSGMTRSCGCLRRSPEAHLARRRARLALAP